MPNIIPNIKNPVVLFVLTFILMTAFTICVQADDEHARDIMQKVDARDDGDNMVASLEMILIDKDDKQRVRKIQQFRKDKGEDKQSLLFFLHPADVKDTGFLTYDYDTPDKDDEQWLYLPALHKSKRIAASDKSGSFMGSDFNYSDMTSRNLEDYDFTLMKESDVAGDKVWLIETLPRSQKIIDESGYKKSVLFVRQDNYVVIRAVHWTEEGEQLKYMDTRKLQQIDGIWTATEITMTTKKGTRIKHKTVLKIHDVKFNQPLDAELFSIRRLEKGLE